MSITLTPEQQAQIDPKRLTDDKLPKVFDRVTQKDVPISRDFEAVLIQLDRQTKQSAVSWAQALADYEPEQTELRAVMAQFLDNEFSSLAERVSEADSGLSDFDTIKAGIAKLQVQGGQTVPEVQTLVADLSALLGEHSEKIDRSLGDQVLNRLMYKRLVEDKDIEGIRKELRSFVPALLSY
jgi:hypothetical protein